MNYRAYKLTFPQAVHFGNNRLESSEYVFHSDTLFSALYIEANKRSSDVADRFFDHAKEGNLRWSDTFPYIGDELYLPKPLLKISADSAQQGDSIVKKKYKKLKYVQASLFDIYLRGDYPIERADELSELGMEFTRTSASICEDEDTIPYRIGEYVFNEGCGLYILVGYETEECIKLFDELIDSLSYSGIGGRKSSGLGKFTYQIVRVPNSVIDRLNDNFTKFETLSLSVCEDFLLESVLEKAEYSIEKRGGFTQLIEREESPRKKRDVYAFSVGSTFMNRFNGEIIDVSTDNRCHVYRYMIPMFMGVE